MNKNLHQVSKRTALLATAFAATALLPLGASAALVQLTSNITLQGSQMPPSTNGTSSFTSQITQADSDKTKNAAAGTTNTFEYNAGTGNPVSVAVTKLADGSGASIVSGSIPQVYAAPVVAGGPITDFYFQTGSKAAAGGDITLTFTTGQAYFGLLWGSIGTGDLLTFNLVGGGTQTVTGTQAMAAAMGFNPSNGARDPGGSQYEVINFMNGVRFTSVTFGQTDSPSFESGRYEYSTSNVSAIPEPASVALLGIGATALVALRRRKTLAA